MVGKLTERLKKGVDDTDPASWSWRFDPAPTRAEAALAELERNEVKVRAALAQAQAEVDAARADHRRTRALRTQDAATDAEVKAAQARLDKVASLVEGYEGRALVLEARIREAREALPEIQREAQLKCRARLRDEYKKAVRVLAVKLIEARDASALVDTIFKSAESSFPHGSDAARVCQHAAGLVLLSYAGLRFDPWDQWNGQLGSWLRDARNMNGQNLLDGGLEHLDARTAADVEAVQKMQARPRLEAVQEERVKLRLLHEEIRKRMPMEEWNAAIEVAAERWRGLEEKP